MLIPSLNAALLRFESYLSRDRYLNFFFSIQTFLTQLLTEVQLVHAELSEPSWFGRKTSMRKRRGTMEKLSPEFAKCLKPELWDLEAWRVFEHSDRNSEHQERSI